MRTGPVLYVTTEKVPAKTTAAVAPEFFHWNLKGPTVELPSMVVRRASPTARRPKSGHSMSTLRRMSSIASAALACLCLGIGYAWLNCAPIRCLPLSLSAEDGSQLPGGDSPLELGVGSSLDRGHAAGILPITASTISWVGHRPLSEEVTIPAPGPGTTVGDEACPVERRILIAIVPSHLLLGTYEPWPWPAP